MDSGANVDPTDQCPPSRPVDEGTTSQTLTVGGKERTYRLHIPASYDGTAAVPLVVTIHGLRSNADQQLRYSRWTELAEAEGVVVVAPQALGSQSIWNILAPPTEATSDARYILDVVAAVRASVCIDDDRVFANGISLGSAMTQMLACANDGTFASFAGVAAAARPAPLCGDAPPTPLRYFHGTADPIVPFAGGRSLMTPVRPAAEVMAEWAMANGCTDGPTDVQISTHVDRRSWDNL